MEVKEFVSEKEQRVCKAVESYGVPYYAVRKALRKKDVLVNGKRITDDINIVKGDKVKVFYNLDDTVYYTTVFEDDNLLAVYKYAAITTEDLAERLKIKGVKAVHRIDRNTEGVLLFAKNEIAEKELVNGFKKGLFEKYYLATVYGIPEKKHDILSARLVKDDVNSIVKITKDKGTPIKTEYTVIKTYNDVYPTSLLLVRLHTGKTHQIRAHLAYIGHFIIGDGKYGEEKINRYFKKKKQMLESNKIVLHFLKDSPLYYLNGKEIVKE